MSCPVGRGTTESRFEMRLNYQIDSMVNASIYNGSIPLKEHGFPDPDAIEAMPERLRTEAGWNLPYLPWYLWWTVRALSFNWEELDTAYVGQLGLGPGAKAFSNNVMLQHLPNRCCDWARPICLCS